MSRLMCLAGLFAMVSLSSGADDKDAKRDPEAIFKKIDANSDGKVSKEEFAKAMDQLREKLGKDKADEGKAKEFIGKLFEKLDANNDGSLSLEEFKKMQEMFEKLREKRKKDQ